MNATELTATLVDRARGQGVRVRRLDGHLVQLGPYPTDVAWRILGEFRDRTKGDTK